MIGQTILHYKVLENPCLRAERHFGRQAPKWNEGGGVA
jgi:hypothetical protein